MLEIDVYQINKEFNFVEFVQTFVGAKEDCSIAFPEMIYRVVGEVKK